jgi:acetyl esterase/lipase
VLRFQPRRAVTVLPKWFVSWLAQLFSPQFALLAIGVAIAGVAGSASTADRWITVVAAVLAAGLFVRIHRDGYRAGALINGVVDASLSRLGQDQALAGTDPTPPQDPRFAGLRPFHFRRPGVSRIRNVSYGDAGRENCLDIYQPLERPDRPMPILIQVPGGAWMTGSKDHQSLPLLQHMAANGWTCFAINYRLAPKARFPAMLEDVLRAIVWVKAHAAEYGADPGFVAITGNSAGGHLLSLAALIRDRARFQPGFETADTRVSVAIPVYGRYDFLNIHQLLPDEGLAPFLTALVMPGPPESCHELWELASPELQVHADAPPFFVVHGSGDAMIPVEEARAFTRALRAVSSQAVDYAELPGAEHGFDLLCTSWSVPAVHAISRYLAGHYRHYRERSGSSGNLLARGPT